MIFYTKKKRCIQSRIKENTTKGQTNNTRYDNLQ